MRSQARFILSTWAALLVGVTLTLGQEQSGAAETPCVGSSVISVPSRPTVTSATDTTQCGVVELEYGLERQWLGGVRIAMICLAACASVLPANWTSTGPRPIFCAS